MPKIDLENIELHTGSGYPGKLADEMAGRSSYALGDAGGLTQFGANLVILEPGAKSSLRHWHEREDEFLMVVAGTLVLIEDHGETELATGDFAAFPAGVANGHQLINRSALEARFLVIGTRDPEEVAWYSDHDMKVVQKAGTHVFTKGNGDPLA